MRREIGIVLLCCVFSVYSDYSGPFLMWGLNGLSDEKLPALQAIDDQNLRDIYTKASAIVIFIRNATTKLNYENFPELSDIIGKNEWLYLPQETLSSDPLEYNVNAEVFTLTGPVMMQDNEIAVFYRDAQISYGNKNVLGILATRNEVAEHLVFKREAKENAEMKEEEKNKTEKYLYGNGRALYHSTKPMRYIIKINETHNHEYSLKKNDTVSIHEHEGTLNLSIKFILPDRMMTTKFVFNKTNPINGYWYVKYIELEDKGESLMLKINRTLYALSTPTNQSHICALNITFWHPNVSLVLHNFQLEPYLNGSARFRRTYDCAGPMTPGIAAGTFVMVFMAIIMTCGLTAILDIKSPNKFENRNSKPLTFNVQE